MGWVLVLCLATAPSVFADGKQMPVTDKPEKETPAKVSPERVAEVNAAILWLKENGYASANLVDKRSGLQRQQRELSKDYALLEKRRVQVGIRHGRGVKQELLGILDRQSEIKKEITENKLRIKAMEVVIYAPINLETFTELTPEVYALAMMNRAKDRDNSQLASHKVRHPYPVRLISDVFTKREPARQKDGPDVQSSAPTGNTNEAGVAN